MTSEFAENKRHFQRILYSAQAQLSSETTSHECKIVDLSLKGCLLTFQQPCPVSRNTLHNLVLNLSEDACISMSLRLVHIEGHNAGFECQHIDIDSISSLRRLIELNLGNSQLLERDLASLCL